MQYPVAIVGAATVLGVIVGPLLLGLFGVLAAGQVRAVSYGEDNNRLVRPGATGEAGRDNRCVSLVIDYAGASAAKTAAM